MNKYCLITTTCDDKATLQKIASVLIDSRLAACIQISGPIESHYRWEGKLETSNEWLCNIKTKSDRFDDVEATIREIHSYDEPEIIVTDIVNGSEGYLKWIDEMVD